MRHIQASSRSGWEAQKGRRCPETGGKTLLAAGETHQVTEREGHEPCWGDTRAASDPAKGGLIFVLWKAEGTLNCAAFGVRNIGLAVPRPSTQAQN